MFNCNSPLSVSLILFPIVPHVGENRETTYTVTCYAFRQNHTSLSNRHTDRQTVPTDEQNCGIALCCAFRSHMRQKIDTADL